MSWKTVTFYHPIENIVLILIHVGNINCLGEADNYNYVDNAFILLLKILRCLLSALTALKDESNTSRVAVTCNVGDRESSAQDVG